MHQVSIITINFKCIFIFQKKRKKKKKKKKLKKEESELEIYSRIPYKPLFIAPRMVPSARGLKTWAYFNEPKSCYLVRLDLSVSKDVRISGEKS